MNRRTLVASIGVGALGFSSGCSSLLPEEEYSITLENFSDSDHSIRVHVGEHIPAWHGGGSFHYETYNLEAKERKGPILLDTGTPAMMRIVVDDELIRIIAWPSSLDSPGEIASNVAIHIGLDLPIGQRVQVFGDR